MGNHSLLEIITRKRLRMHLTKPPTYPTHKSPGREIRQRGSEKTGERDMPLTGLSPATAPDYCAGGAAGLALALCFFGAGALRDCGCTWVSSTVVPSSSCPPHKVPSGTK